MMCALGKPLKYSDTLQCRGLLPLLQPFINGPFPPDSTMWHTTITCKLGHILHFFHPARCDCNEQQNKTASTCNARRPHNLVTLYQCCGFSQFFSLLQTNTGVLPQPLLTASFPIHHSKLSSSISLT